MKSKPSTEPGEVKAQVIILDAGSQYGKLIDRRVRELGVKCDIAPLDAPTATLKQYEAIIISGGPASVAADDARSYNPDIFKLNKPILGICYGLQLGAHHYGGDVGQHERREDGPTVISVNTDTQLFDGLESEQRVIMSHGESVLTPPDDFTVTAESNGIVAAVESTRHRFIGTQFHPEVTHTDHGKAMISNFLFGFAKLTPDYEVEDKLTEAINHIRQQVRNRDVECFVSGGLDSSTTAALLMAAELPGRLRFVFVDNGFLRDGEVKQVLATYRAMGMNVVYRDESERFMKASTVLRSGEQSVPLYEAVDPQEIRQIIGNTFIDVRVEDLADNGWDEETTVLAMGTLRPDLIESGSAKASVNTDEGGIKIHHNDTDDVRRLREKDLVVEPLSELHKDEVREIARRLELPDKIITRQPNPGPAGAVRIMTQIEPYVAEDVTLKQLDKQLDAYRQTQAGENLGMMIMQTQTVGVQGDRRSYSHLLALSSDREPNFEELAELANEIPRQLKGVNRVVYVAGHKLDGLQAGVNDGITQTLLNDEIVSQWRLVDAVAREVLAKYGLDNTLTISQVPIILSPLNFGQPEQRTVGIRPFMTEDYMTGDAAIPGKEFPIEAYREIVTALQAVDGITRVAFDLSSKPPAPTEWR